MRSSIATTIMAAQLVFSNYAYCGSKPIIVAVIDTGIDKTVPNLCKFGHYDFITRKTESVDVHGHGTHVAGLIAREAGDSGYCMVSMRYYADSNTGAENMKNSLAALQRAINLKVDFINYSGGGEVTSTQEKALILKAIGMGMTVVVAAGNEKHNLDVSCNYYPACYDKRLIVVGNLERDRSCSNGNDMLSSFTELIFPTKTCSAHVAPSSNYGNIVNRWEVGTDVESFALKGKRARMSGTSQATAVATGKLVKAKLNRR